jgi:hypothetical protein
MSTSNEGVEVVLLKTAGRATIGYRLNFARLQRTMVALRHRGNEKKYLFIAAQYVSDSALTALSPASTIRVKIRSAAFADPQGARTWQVLKGIRLFQPTVGNAAPRACPSFLRSVC